MENHSDQELMEKVRLGDFQAFDSLYHCYQARVRRFLYLLCWDGETADDLTQEVFLRIWRRREHYRPCGAFANYALQIAKNCYLDLRRAGKRRVGERPLEPERPDGSPFRAVKADSRVEPEERLMEDYRRYRIRKAIALLPEPQQMVFVLAHLEGLKYAEIAQILQVPCGTVKSRMHAAVTTLRRLLEEEMP